ncbi:hypothetical protein HNY73_019403 [Argiope bruennichi]|uniref:Uncharacterized protein n=1 Tax=Argiope bruennichi TaxID=94029 RepID=A0A8T0EH68_ARGBR|nr:hypothetical protein HNY73_019403 [Argiope bruennichi]
MSLHKWTSNSQELLNSFPTSNPENAFPIDEQVSKALGMHWKPFEDLFIFTVKYENESMLTKRTVLSVIARLYYPLGLLGPVISKMKTFLQKLWLQKLTFDDPLPPVIGKEWSHLVQYLRALELFSHTPRGRYCKQIIKPSELSRETIILSGLGKSQVKTKGSFRQDIELDGQKYSLTWHVVPTSYLDFQAIIGSDILEQASLDFAKEGVKFRRREDVEIFSMHAQLYEARPKDEIEIEHISSPEMDHNAVLDFYRLSGVGLIKRDKQLQQISFKGLGINYEMSSDECGVNTYVYQKWLELTADVENSIKEKWWNTLKSHYSEDSRKYHTFFHLKHMFNHLESLNNEIQNKNAVSYAIFFHDAVYDARSQENEEQSIKLFNEFASESGISKEVNIKSSGK